MALTVRECICTGCGIVIFREPYTLKYDTTFCTRACYKANGRRRRKYTLNETFFADITTPEQAHILGFIAADGTIGNHESRVAIGVHPRDVDILEKIRFHLGNNSPIRYYDDTSKTPTRAHYEMAMLYLNSTRLVQDLIALGITPRKSLILQWPSLLKHLERHYIRGLWDGDGYIGPEEFNLVGTYGTTYGAQQAILAATGRTLKLIHIQGETYRLIGYKASSSALDWLYQGSTIHLQRKFMRYQQWWIRAERHQLSLF